ncbi:hypothetical protein EC973_006626 [Apophysomyces ossiformis]|uniref:O-methyltransferase n=1 Tax=Apophysomyces ossiformis TaxID=679940 RepID=A0A8H7BQE8_9FUNG|nr:hypothetical protein EC973_006626 [Apophysomyces ossiformis]
MNHLLRKPFPRCLAICYSVRRHTNRHVQNNIGNTAARLRVHEDRYADDVSTALPVQSVLSDLKKETEGLFHNAGQMVGHVQAKLLHQIVALQRPRRVLEIGTFTGSSAIAMASALPAESSLVTLEVSAQHADVARRYIEKARMGHQVEVKVGPAIDSLNALSQSKAEFDLIFIDANKLEYHQYFDICINNNLLSDHGVMLVDNVLFFGQVHRLAGYESLLEVPKKISKRAKALQEFNQHVLQDPRVEVVMLPIFDGLSIIRKRREN